MSIDTSAKLIVGAEYSKLYELLTEDEIESLNDWLDVGDIDYASPYYDAGRDEWFVGYVISKETSAEKLGFLVGEINLAVNSFISKFGKDHSHLIKIRACAHVM